MFKLGTVDYPCTAGDKYAPAGRGLPQLRLQGSSVASSVNQKTLLEHALVREAMAYWTEALNVLTVGNAAAAKISAVS